MMAFASWIVDGLTKIASIMTGMKLGLFLASPPLTTTPNIYDLVSYAAVALTSVVMLLFLRLSPLSGYHAAEHMTVHAIEAGEELTPEVVRHMPRVHPRCGTNLLAAASVFMIITSRFSGQVSVIIAMLVVVVGWRTVGGWLQYFVTTKRPSEQQLKNGVAAGNQLMERYQEQPNYQVGGWRRI